MKAAGVFDAIVSNPPFFVNSLKNPDSTKGVHHAKVMYVIEGLFRKPEFRGFVLDKGCQPPPSGGRDAAGKCFGGVL